VFTGLIQGLGALQPVEGDKLQVTCSANSSGLILEDLAVGDSVAVDGVCLTVIEVQPQGFVAVASPETRDRSTLGQTDLAWVNLETSLRVGSKLGGHFVTGHVDGKGRLQRVVQTASSWEMTFTAQDPQVARYIIPKGSVAVNGISLTVADCLPDGTQFTVAVIPHTYQETNLQYLQPGSWVNLEGDILGKYVEKFLHLDPSNFNSSAPASPWESLTPGFLTEHGYL
jgi:riboflavin synthase